MSTISFFSVWSNSFRHAREDTSSQEQLHIRSIWSREASLFGREIRKSRIENVLVQIIPQLWCKCFCARARACACFDLRASAHCAFVLSMWRCPTYIKDLIWACIEHHKWSDIFCCFRWSLYRVATAVLILQRRWAAHGRWNLSLFVWRRCNSHSLHEK